MQKIPMLMTRPEAANAALTDALPEKVRERLSLVPCPLIGIEPTTNAQHLDPDHAAIFTSSNGVRFAPPGLGRRAFCVGTETTRRARDAGWQAQCGGQDARALLDFLLSERPDMPLRHLSGVHVRGRIVETLTENGFDAGRIVLYDQVLLPLSPQGSGVLSTGKPVIVPLFSPRAAAHFAALAPEDSRGDLVLLSPAVAEAAGNPGAFDLRTVPEPTMQAMVAEIEKSVDSFRLG